MEPLKIFQVCSKCGHVQAVKYWGQTRWQCSNYGCKRINDIKTEINMKPLSEKDIDISGKGIGEKS